MERGLHPALTGHSPIDRLAAVRLVKPAIRCNREIKRVANSQSADKPALCICGFRSRSILLHSLQSQRCGAARAVKAAARRN
jgi:hypothetical protein